MHENLMRRCLELARRGAGRVSPNPMVGAVIVHGDKIIGEGFHTAYGAPHAEVEAVRAVTEQSLLASSTLYVSLEPCCHHGKTPPCTDLIIANRIPRVVMAATDPNALVNGGGRAVLLEAGVQITSGVLDAEARELNRGFYSYHERKRPWVILKWAQTADGYIARDDGHSKWISSEASRALVHAWRAVEDAVLVGTKTALLDNPELTVRLTQGRNPVRVVVDKDGKLPAASKLFNAAAPTIVLTRERNEKTQGVRYRPLQHHLAPAAAVLKALYDERILTVIVEGGTETIHHFLEEDLWDEARVFMSNENFGSGIRAPSIYKAPLRSESIGGDTLLTYRREPITGR